MSNRGYPPNDPRRLEAEAKLDALLAEVEAADRATGPTFPSFTGLRGTHKFFGFTQEETDAFWAALEERIIREERQHIAECDLCQEIGWSMTCPNKPEIFPDDMQDDWRKLWDSM